MTREIKIEFQKIYLKFDKNRCVEKPRFRVSLTPSYLKHTAKSGKTIDDERIGNAFVTRSEDNHSLHVGFCGDKTGCPFDMMDRCGFVDPADFNGKWESL